MTLPSAFEVLMFFSNPNPITPAQIRFFCHPNSIHTSFLVPTTAPSCPNTTIEQQLNINALLRSGSFPTRTPFPLLFCLLFSGSHVRFFSHANPIHPSFLPTTTDPSHSTMSITQQCSNNTLLVNSRMMSLLHSFPRKSDMPLSL